MSDDLFKFIKGKKGIVRIILNRPQLHNAFNDDMITGLIKAFADIEKDEGLRLVTITGEGKSFCAGADLNWMKKMVSYSAEENLRDSEALAKLFESINNCHLPVLAKVNGAALGGGTGVVAACDFVLSAKSAKFGFTEVRLGLIPAVISPFVIAKIGESNARAWFLSGERFSAEKAMDMGLVHEVCPLDSLDIEFEGFVESFLKAAPLAAVEAKKLIKKVKNLDEQAATDLTCKTISRIRTSAEGQEGMQALLDKRKANWLDQ
jgi:methylglutaconyl-CoA hydratase